MDLTPYKEKNERGEFVPYHVYIKQGKMIFVGLKRLWVPKWVSSFFGRLLVHIPFRWIFLIKLDKDSLATSYPLDGKVS